jgi:L-aspartate oxidase
MIRSDHLVIGSGIAGLSFALKAAAEGSVTVITKSAAAECNTAYAQGGIACVTSEEDSFDLHLKDTLVAGAGLCDEAVSRQIVMEGPARVRELIALGVQFDQREVGEDGSTEAVRSHPAITVLENHMAVDLVTLGKLGYASENRVVGVYVLDEATGIVHTLRSDRVVLATGGCGKVYLYTTNPDVATGDGLAMAWRAGARVANMEFIQFHPTCLFHPEERSFLISEAVRGEGGILLNARGERFMERYDERKELAPRDIVARAIDAEMKRTGARCMYLDISHRPAEFVRERFPNIESTCRRLGIDITREPIPVVPAAHYQCGGVETDVDGATSLRGLYALGEVGCTGLHGANRLASNSLLEAVTLAHRCHERMQRGRRSGDDEFSHAYPIPDWASGDAQDMDEAVVITHNWEEIRRLMWDYVGIVRTTKRLQRASARLRNLEHEIREFYWNFKVTKDLLELRNLCTVASLIVDCALMRQESRGLHYTLDYPAEREAFRRNTVIRRAIV